MNLITVDGEGFPIFNPEAKLIKEFNVIVRRDRGSKGDHDGREKRLATKELAFVHYISHHNSEFILSYPEHEREDRIRKSLELPEDWKPDAAIKAAIVAYKELNHTASLDALLEAEEALFSTSSLVKLLRRRLEARIRTLEEVIEGNDDVKELDKAMTDYDKLSSVSNKIPMQIDTIVKLQEKVKKENYSEQRGRKNLAINQEELERD